MNESTRVKKEWAAPKIERVGTFGAIMRSGGSRSGPDSMDATMKMAPNAGP